MNSFQKCPEFDSFVTMILQMRKLKVGESIAQRQINDPQTLCFQSLCSIVSHIEYFSFSSIKKFCDNRF